MKTKDPISLPFDESTLLSSGLFNGTKMYIPTLTFLSGEALGKELPLVQPQVILGRGEEADLLVADPSVSRKHVQLTCRKVVSKGSSQAFKVVLQDLGSKNGTLVNYKRVSRALLKPGDKILLGKIILKFEYKDLADQNFYDELYRLATIDSLTSLFNKGTITRILADEIIKQQRYGRCLSVLLLDIDDFKILNDTHGHLKGDLALQKIATVLSRNLRRQDKAGRFGGEEFLVILPETGLRGAMSLAERIRRDVERSVSEELGLERKVTASIGVATSLGKGNGGDLVHQADDALYQAKGAGKNRVELWRQQFTPTNTE